MSENKIIYSSDGSGRNLVATKDKKGASSYKEIIPTQTTLKLRLEKKGRGGKTVSIVYGLGDNPPYFKELLKELKNNCGTGGTLKGDQMELQGDYLDRLRDLLEKKGFSVKG